MRRDRAHVLDGREALASGAATVAKDGAPALFGVAIEKPMLPFAADFRWLILPFHVVLSFKTRGKALNGSGEDSNEQGCVNLRSAAWVRLKLPVKSSTGNCLACSVARR